ncbi:MAG: cation-transporting P-type ATPase, partial [Betaproteobacteria bacterium]|nr:cation-transporting P-type ATPase [Betaproteobacteria bacterium]
MRITQIGVQQAIESLRSHADGLSSQEAGRRLAEFGPNRVEEIKGEHLLLRLAREFTHFFALILWIAAGLAFVAELNDPGKGMATLAYAIIGVIVINGAFSFWQEYRAERAIAALKDLLPPHATVLRNGIASRVPAEELVPGDMLLVREGDDIPADCRLIEAMGMRVNTATMTGESVPIALSAEPSDEIELLACRNVLLAGTAAVSGEGRAIVFATGMRTEFGRIAHLTQTGRADQSPLQREIARLSRLVALLATVVGVAFFFIGQLLGLSFWENFIFAIGIIVANVPEGLLPTVTLSLAIATQRMARRNALVRHLAAVEALGSATVILSDKTGTLTLNRMALRTVFLAERSLSFPLAERDAVAQHTPFFLIALHCNNLREVAQDGRTALLGDPMEAALRGAARAVLAPAREYPRFGELPFDADRKCMSTAHQTPYGQVLYCKGAPETVLPLCTSVWTRDGARPLDAAMRGRFRLAQEEMAERGLRILLLSFRSLPIGCPQEQWESDLTLAGLAGIEDPPRPEVPLAIQRCREAGIKVIMVTGDHPHTALAIGREIGMIRSTKPLVITGPELARMRETQIQLALDAEEILFARVSADQKMHIVEGLKRKGHVVAATGDGVNDAPALKRADIGIAMGISGTDVARESADMVLLDDNFASIVSAIEEGRAVYANIRKFLTYILTSNIPELVPYLAFVVLKIPLPLTIIQILAVD